MYAFYVLFDVSKCDVLYVDVCRVFIVVECNSFILSGALCFARE